MDRKERTIGKGVHLAKTSLHRDRGWQMDYPRVGSGQDLGFAKCAAKGVYPARVWLANNVQVLRDVTPLHGGTHVGFIFWWVALFLWQAFMMAMSCTNVPMGN